MADKNYVEVPHQPIRNSLGPNLFVGTGGQINDPYLYGVATQSQVNDNPRVVFQPVVRLQYAQQSRLHGSTSFMNVCTEVLGSSPATFCSMFEDWLDVFSAFGLYTPHLTLMLEALSDDWGLGQFEQSTLTIFASGIEIANFNYCVDVPSVGVSSTQDIADLSVGLERLVYAAAGRDHYFECIGPQSHTNDRDVLDQCDRIRTLCLLVGSGETLDHTGRGSKLKILARDVAAWSAEAPVGLATYYHDQWAVELGVGLAVDAAETADRVADAFYSARYGLPLKWTTKPRTLKDVDVHLRSFHGPTRYRRDLDRA